MQLPPPLTLHYWFAISPTPFMFWVDIVLWVFFGLMFVAGIAAFFVKGKSKQDKLVKRAIGRLGNLFITMSLVGLLLQFFNYERINILSMRVLYPIWLAGTAFWAWTIYRYWTVEIPKILQKRQADESVNKWLPKKK